MSHILSRYIIVWTLYSTLKTRATYQTSIIDNMPPALWIIPTTKLTFFFHSWKDNIY